MQILEMPLSILLIAKLCRESSLACRPIAI